MDLDAIQLVRTQSSFACPNQVPDVTRIEADEGACDRVHRDRISAGHDQAGGMIVAAGEAGAVPPHDALDDVEIRPDHCVEVADLVAPRLLPDREPGAALLEVPALFGLGLGAWVTPHDGDAHSWATIGHEVLGGNGTQMTLLDRDDCSLQVLDTEGGHREVVRLQFGRVDDISPLGGHTSGDPDLGEDASLRHRDTDAGVEVEVDQLDPSIPGEPFVPGLTEDLLHNALAFDSGGLRDRDVRASHAGLLQVVEDAPHERGMCHDAGIRRTGQDDVRLDQHLSSLWIRRHRPEQIVRTSPEILRRRPAIDLEPVHTYRVVSIPLVHLRLHFVIRVRERSLDIHP